MADGRVVAAAEPPPGRRFSGGRQAGALGGSDMHEALSHIDYAVGGNRARRTSRAVVPGRAADASA